MKLTRLSLAAIVAVGALTSIASAQPLEDAIKGVEVSGFARYRLYVQDPDHSKYYGVNGDKGNERNRFSGLLNIESPVADNIKFGISLATDNNNFAASEESKAGGVAVNKFWFSYAWNALNVKVGKIEIPTPWTEAGFAGTRGNGLLAMFTGLEGWAFAAAAYTQTNGHALGMHTAVNDTHIGQENLYALAAIGAVGPVNIQVWAARMDNIIDYTVFGQVEFAKKFGNMGISVRGQANYLKLDDFGQLALGQVDDAGIFYGVEAGLKADNFFVTAGFTMNDEDQAYHALSIDNDGGQINFGQQLYKVTTNAADAKVFFIKGGASVKKFGFEAGYGYAEGVKNISFDDASEFYGLVSFQAAKNFGLELYYSMMETDFGNKYYSGDNNEIRFQAKYNF